MFTPSNCSNDCAQLTRKKLNYDVTFRLYIGLELSMHYSNALLIKMGIYSLLVI